MRKIVIAVFLVMMMVTQANAITIVSAEIGSGLTSYNTSTAGSSSAPWTIVESISDPMTLKFFENTAGATISALAPGNPTGSGHTYGKWIEKTVTNNSGAAWTSFELELQVSLGIPSPDGDGLSFAQGGGLAFFSNEFSAYSRIDTTKDYLNFHDGVVGIGESVTFAFAISDNQLRNTFYLLETPNKREVSVPEPTTMLLLALGLMGLAGMRRKIKE